MHRWSCKSHARLRSSWLKRVFVDIETEKLAHMVHGVAKGLHICCRGGKSRVLRCAALGLSDLEGLRVHQREALDFIEVEAQPETVRRRSLLVFSGKPLLEQFKAAELEACGAEIYAVYSNVQSVDANSISEKLKEEGEAPLLVLTTYSSLPKIHEALRRARTDAPDLCFTACCFDEAHNLHTASRRHLWDVEERIFEDDEDSEEEDVQMLDAEEFSSMYPWRLYATATPRQQMRDHPEIYGDFDEDWFRYRYVDLLRDQDPLNPMVKPFDLSIAVGGRPEEAEQSAEFFDWVSILREISWRRDSIHRVMVYLSRAVEGEAQQTRSAEHFASATHRLWAAALTYLHGRGEALSLDERSLVVTHANGTMRADEVRSVKDRFNAPVVDDKVHVLCSCQVFAEGVTLEHVDLTVFADGKKSERDVVQSGMRGLKASADDPEARLRILLLVHLDAVGLAGAQDAEEVSNRIAESLRSRKKMDRMAAVLAALKEEDESLAEELRALATRAEVRKGDGDCRGDRSEGDGSGESDGNSGSDGSNGSDGDVSVEGNGRGRITVRMEPELIIRWTASEAEIADAAARMAGSVVIELDRARLTSKEMIVWKVKFLCAAWPDLEVPKQGDKRAAPQELAAEARAAGFILEPLDGGSFLRRVYHNWTDGAKPQTILHTAEKEVIEAMPWFLAWRGGVYGAIRWKVKLLGAAWSSLEVPKCKEKRSASPDLAAEARAAGFVLDPLDGGHFLSRVYHNWTEGGKPHTKLRPAEKEDIEAMPWFLAWRGGVYGAIRWKVKLLGDAWSDLEVPKCKEKRSASPELAEEARTAGFFLEPLDGGCFLDSVYHNWTEGGKPHTKLRPSEKEAIEAMPWFPAWRGGKYGPVFWKVKLLCAAWPDLEVPKRREKRSPSPGLAAETLAAGFILEPLDGGSFLDCVYHNWTEGGKPNTKLRPSEKEAIEAMPWFLAWRGGVYGAICWKVKLLCATWPDLEVPKCREKRSASSELTEEARAAGFVLEPLDGGCFLNSIYHNWTEGGKPDTTLRPAEKEAIEAMPWFRAWRGGVYGSICWKVKLLCATWRSLEVPKRKEKRSASSELTEEARAAGFVLEPLDGGSFLHNVYHNWTEGEKAHTTLRPAEKEAIEAMPWFSVWRRRRKRKLDTDASSSAKSRRTESADPNENESTGVPEPGRSDSLEEAQMIVAMAASASEAQTTTTSEAYSSENASAASSASSSSGYNASTFSVDHLTFKDECNSIFVRNVLDFCDPCCNVAYLDAFDGTEAKELRTTKALLAAGVAPSRLYMANPDGAVCRELKKYGADTHEACCTFVAALGNEWRAVRFGAVYLDLCTGSSEEILDNLAAALPTLERRCAVGFTFTRRDGSGETAVERQYKIEGFLKEHGFERSSHDGLRVFSPSGVYTQFYARS